MAERFYASGRTVVLDLNSAEKIVKRVFRIKRNLTVSWRRSRHRQLKPGIVVRTRNIAFQPNIPTKVIHARHIKAVKRLPFVDKILKTIVGRYARIDLIVRIAEK
jgi:hypothetical protein